MPTPANAAMSVPPTQFDIVVHEVLSKADPTLIAQRIGLLVAGREPSFQHALTEVGGDLEQLAVKWLGTRFISANPDYFAELAARVDYVILRSDLGDKRTQRFIMPSAKAPADDVSDPLKGLYASFAELFGTETTDAPELTWEQRRTKMAGLGSIALTFAQAQMASTPGAAERNKKILSLLSDVYTKFLTFTESQWDAVLETFGDEGRAIVVRVAKDHFGVEIPIEILKPATCPDCGLRLDGSSGVPCTCALGRAPVETPAPTSVPTSVPTPAPASQPANGPAQV